MTDTLDQVSAGIDSKKFHWEFNSAGLTLSPSLSDFIGAEYTEAEAISLIQEFHFFYHELGQRIKKAEGEDLVVLMRVYNDLADANNAVLKYAGPDYEGLALHVPGGLNRYEDEGEVQVEDLVSRIGNSLPKILAANDDPRLIPYLEMDFIEDPETWVFPVLTRLLGMVYCSTEIAQHVIDKLAELNTFINSYLAYFIEKKGGIKLANYYNQLVSAHNHVRLFLPGEKPKPMICISAHDLGRIANLSLDGEYLIVFFQRVMVERGN